MGNSQTDSDLYRPNPFVRLIGGLFSPFAVIVTLLVGFFSLLFFRGWQSTKALCRDFYRRYCRFFFGWHQLDSKPETTTVIVSNKLDLPSNQALSCLSMPDFDEEGFYTELKTIPPALGQVSATLPAEADAVADAHSEYSPASSEQALAVSVDKDTQQLIKAFRRALSEDPSWVDVFRSSADVFEKMMRLRCAYYFRPRLISQSHYYSIASYTTYCYSDNRSGYNHSLRGVLALQEVINSYDTTIDAEPLYQAMQKALQLKVPEGSVDPSAVMKDFLNNVHRTPKFNMLTVEALPLLDTIDTSISPDAPCDQGQKKAYLAGKMHRHYPKYQGEKLKNFDEFMVNFVMQEEWGWRGTGELANKLIDQGSVPIDFSETVWLNLAEEKILHLLEKLPKKHKESHKVLLDVFLHGTQSLSRLLGEMVAVAGNPGDKGLVVEDVQLHIMNVICQMRRVSGYVLSSDFDKAMKFLITQDDGLFVFLVETIFSHMVPGAWVKKDAKRNDVGEDSDPEYKFSSKNLKSPGFIAKMGGKVVIAGQAAKLGRMFLNQREIVSLSRMLDYFSVLQDLENLWDNSCPNNPATGYWILHDFYGSEIRDERVQTYDDKHAQFFAEIPVCDFTDFRQLFDCAEVAFGHNRLVVATMHLLGLHLNSVKDSAFKRMAKMPLHSMCDMLFDKVLPDRLYQAYLDHPLYKALSHVLRHKIMRLEEGKAHEGLCAIKRELAKHASEFGRVKPSDTAEPGAAPGMTAPNDSEVSAGPLFAPVADEDSDAAPSDTSSSDTPSTPVAPTDTSLDIPVDGSSGKKADGRRWTMI